MARGRPYTGRNPHWNSSKVKRIHESFGGDFFDSKKLKYTGYRVADFGVHVVNGEVYLYRKRGVLKVWHLNLTNGELTEIDNIILGKDFSPTERHYNLLNKKNK